jgi:hypothetical protein
MIESGFCPCKYAHLHIPLKKKQACFFITQWFSKVPTNKLSQGEENSSTTPLVIPWYLPNVLQNKQIDHSKSCTEQNTLFIEHTWNHQTFIHKFWFPHWRWHHNLSSMHRTISQCYHKTNQNPLFLLQQWFKIEIICSDWLPLYNTHSNLRFHLCEAQPESLLFAWDP